MAEEFKTVEMNYLKLRFEQGFDGTSYYGKNILVGIAFYSLEARHFFRSQHTFPFYLGPLETHGA